MSEINVLCTGKKSNNEEVIMLWELKKLDIYKWA